MPNTPTTPPTAPPPAFTPPPVNQGLAPNQPRPGANAPLPSSSGVPITVPQQAQPQLPPGAPPPGGRPQRQGIGPGGAAAIGAAAGLVGGFLIGGGARRLNEVRDERQEVIQDGTRYIREPGRVIEQRNGETFIRHDENERFRDLGYDVRNERRGEENLSFYDRPDGERIVTITDDDGRLVRRYRRYRDGREVIILDNGPRRRFEEDVIVLPPPPILIPRDRYILNADSADDGLIYETLLAPPVQATPRRYTLDEVRNSPNVRAYMRSVDVDTINFESGSWEVTPDQANRLATIATALKRAIEKNPNEVFLVEGHTDAVGADVDNLSLSDRRAQSVAAVLTKTFAVPPENLTTQGYGEQYLKVQTQAASRENRRVTLRRITPLLNTQK